MQCTKKIFLLIGYFLLVEIPINTKQLVSMPQQKEMQSKALLYEVQEDPEEQENSDLNDDENVPFETDLNLDTYSITEKQKALAAKEGIGQANVDANPEEPEKTLSKGPLYWAAGNLTGKFQIKYKPETFYAKNANLLNSANKSDEIFFSRSTIDINMGLYYGKEFYGFDILDFFITLRNKSNWGNPDTIARTTTTRIKTLDSLDGGHLHFITRQIFWMREMWLKFSIKETFGIPLENKHFFTMGAFPFELGRGISLGSAYAVNPGVLGFFSDNSIDQYAFGYKLNGEIVPSLLTYDLYLAMLQNKADTFFATGENIYGQEYGRIFDQARGPWHINYVFAGRAKWMPIKTSCNLMTIEPYFLYNSDPEQLVDFPADARAKLGTFGCAGEFTFGSFDFGFDAAANVGHQHVLGWDRNQVDRINDRGVFTVIDSQVVTADPTINPKAPNIIYAPTNANGREVQRIIDSTEESASQNGKFIGLAPNPTTPDDPTKNVTLFNSLNRFRDSYNNKFKGWMVVGDIAYWFAQRTMRFAIGGGAASGDKDPNVDIENPNDSNFDGDYKGFIGLQELYTGDRVQSVFLLGGAGRIPRPLLVPTGLSVLDRIPTNVSGFNNLVFVGGSYLWSPKMFKKNFNLRPNILAYWQQFTTNKFDLITKKSSLDPARNFLGTEINTFFDLELVRDFKFFLVGSVFFPGGHFTDIKGTPLSKDQQRILDRLDVTGVDTVPLLGDSTAYTLNIGLEYRF